MKKSIRIVHTLSGISFPIIAAAVLLTGCAKSPSVSVVDSLRSIVAQGKIAYAHQDDLVYGHSWVVEDVAGDPLERSDVKSVCGDYPFMVGFDLGGIELGNPANLDGVPFDLMRRAAITHISRGGMVTFSWHPRNPYTGGDAWDVSSDKVVASILEGGEKHEVFMQWLERAGDFLESLKDDKGKPLPVLFRPWHENVGSWFWWGGRLCTPEQYKALFALTHDYLAVERGLENIAWAYSPNSGISLEEYMERYPGDGIVDVIGVDHYEYLDPNAEITEEKRFEAGNAYYQQVLRQDLSNLEKIAKEHGKVIALSETGLEGIPYPTWWTEVLLPVVKEFPVAYVLTWRNAHDRAGHFYAPFPGSKDSEDFVAFHDDPATLFLGSGQ